MSGATASLVLLAGILAAPTPMTVDRQEHCVVFVIDQRPDGELITSQPVCFPDEAEARVWAGVGYPITRRPVATFNDSGGLALLTFTLGTHYDGSNGTGSSISVVGSSCTGGYWNTSTAWDNRISSSYNGCARLSHWDLPSKSGTHENTYGAGTTDNLTFMDNRTESVSYHSS